MRCRLSVCLFFCFPLWLHVCFSVCPIVHSSVLLALASWPLLQQFGMSIAYTNKKEIKGQGLKEGNQELQGVYCNRPVYRESYLSCIEFLEGPWSIPFVGPIPDPTARNSPIFVELATSDLNPLTFTFVELSLTTKHAFHELDRSYPFSTVS
ncbi:hypothetical protein BC939DRAFT_473302 [Gamsiella multidivaricata]|uniref:uncharacterized protein n=1 Tax=Gamsiella multidivaricata TaxID=101098 RepID=UPI00221F300C|nr:uncharacterized protein BC939DRAFT_473302 [Gamsiella multidivaricata]KAI7831248.1 hypothetical protein BC939DRAFT_473302 [Gamsiella multidivaricata]